MEIACLLEEIQRENHAYKRDDVTPLSCFGADPELDQFMVLISLILLFPSSFFFLSWNQFFAIFRKPTAIYWLSTNPISRGHSMRLRLSWTRSKCSSKTCALVPRLLEVSQVSTKWSLSLSFSISLHVLFSISSCVLSIFVLFLLDLCVSLKIFALISPYKSSGFCKNLSF